MRISKKELQQIIEEAVSKKLSKQDALTELKQMVEESAIDDSDPKYAALIDAALKLISFVDAETTEAKKSIDDLAKAIKDMSTREDCNK